MDASPETATVFADLAAEVEIPVEGTLSRVLYTDDSVRVVVFAFDADQELTEHSTPLPAIIQVVSGRLELDLGGAHVDAGPGLWARMPPSLPHSVRAVEPSIMLLTMVRRV
jgi:quercetin dioxygenase-like cupin family protein